MVSIVEWLTLITWAQGVGRSNRPAPTIRKQLIHLQCRVSPRQSSREASSDQTFATRLPLTAWCARCDTKCFYIGGIILRLVGTMIFFGQNRQPLYETTFFHGA